MSRILKFALLAVGLLVAVAALRFALSERPGETTGLSGDGRTVFTQAAKTACVTAQTGAPDNAGLTAEKIQTFCTCYGDKLADAMTPADVERLSKLTQSEIVAAQEDKADDAFQACSGSIEDGAK